MKYEDDPIKEYHPFRGKIENPLEDESMNDYSYDLHDCSTDLSDRASRIEEFEHAKFAEEKKQAYQNYEDTFKTDINSYISSNFRRNFVNPIIIFICIYVIGIFFIIAYSLSDKFDDLNNKEDVLSNDNYYSNNDFNKVSFQEYKENIEVDIYYANTENRLILQLDNQNNTSYTNVAINVYLYDKDKNYLGMKEAFFNTLIGYNWQFYEITDLPEELETVEVDFVENEKQKNIDFNIFEMDVNLNKGSYSLGDSISIKNYSKININNPTVAVLYINEQGNIKMEKISFNDLNAGDSLNYELRKLFNDDVEVMLVKLCDAYL